MSPDETDSSADLGGSSKYFGETQKTEVEKGSVGSALRHGLVGPKR